MYSLNRDESHSYPDPSQRIYPPHLRSYPPPPIVDAPYDRHYMDYRALTPISSARLPEISRIDTQHYSRREEHSLAMVQPLSATSVEMSTDSEPWSPTQPVRPKKSRREKPHIELAPDQPPTTQGKPRARVYVACLQCRNRKIRCDGAKPVCHNCGKRIGNNECNYDALPKRRGPDKNPGARQRIARKDGEAPPPRRRRATASSSSDIHDDPTTSFSYPSPTSSSEHTHSPEEYIVSPREVSYMRCACHGLAQCPSTRGLGHAVPGPQITVPYDVNPPPPTSLSSPSYITNSDEHNDGYSTLVHAYSTREYPSEIISFSTIISEPSVQFSRKIWWDNLLSLYLSPNPFGRVDHVSDSLRTLASQGIANDLRFLFQASNYWFAFLHAPTFFASFHDPVKREEMQPSLIYAILAISTFWQSSEVGLGHRGRVRALRFREEAQSALEASYNAGRVDDTLAQAAWILAMFEICAHPNHTTDRSTSAMVMLDSLIRSLSLTKMDKNDPNASVFYPGQVPEVPSPPHHLVRSMDNQYDYPLANPLPSNRTCSCLSLTLKEQWAQTMEVAPLWAQTPAWNSEWSEAELKQEACRRLCWSAMILAAGHSNYSYTSRTRSMELFISDPSNYALLFSGESVTHSPAAKDTVWALHDRAFLLWHACVRMRNNSFASMTAKGQFAIRTWHEADAIEDALNRHTCGIERSSIYLGREYIFNTRMCITYEFQRFVPLVSNNASQLFDRQKAEEWCEFFGNPVEYTHVGQVSHHAMVAQSLTTSLHTVTGLETLNLSRRPFFVFWCLTLWHTDNSLTVALDVCKNLLPGIDFLTALWPCTEQRQRYENLRDRIHDTCLLAQVAPPPPINLTLPPRPVVDEFL
ncbi:Zn(2)-C6 fungal-type domain-containing protein [Mycena indigotica]|uniref:Zn(2)-C6 fungal-type domain-containing protein n=1 Tax=Mycena indigotica TaxID=2126181 RepID=A0A8H6SJ99_9AGAR|nr:Zn(2)-C6 fungal-type domain-containing protein [Mycena indigotica]KAF7298870.1 Zn(2)-C6 fungal-type domain-containing protein [Mycena indigotica]